MLSSYNYEKDDSNKVKMSKVNDATLLYKINLNPESDDENETGNFIDDNDDKIPLITNEQDNVIDIDKESTSLVQEEKFTTQGLSAPISLNNKNSLLLNSKAECSVSVTDNNTQSTSYITAENDKIKPEDIDKITPWENQNDEDIKKIELETGILKINNQISFVFFSFLFFNIKAIKFNKFIFINI